MDHTSSIVSGSVCISPFLKHSSGNLFFLSDPKRLIQFQNLYGSCVCATEDSISIYKFGSMLSFIETDSFVNSVLCDFVILTEVSFWVVVF